MKGAERGSHQPMSIEEDEDLVTGPDGDPPARPAPRGGEQLVLFPQAEPLAPEEMRSLLERAVGSPVRLSMTKNRASVLTFKRAGDGSYDVRLQHVFLSAPDDVLEAIVQFVRRPTRAARERVVAFFSARPEAERRDRRPAAPPPEARPAGRVYDLTQIMRELNARYFGDAVVSTITWGDARGAARDGSIGHGRTIRFGSYVGEHDLIRVHPTLDVEWVPRFFVESIVFHEMLHAVIPIERDGHGRRQIHPPSFRKREKEFHAYDEALAWEKANLRRLLSARG